MKGTNFFRWLLIKVVEWFTIPWDRNYNWPGIKVVFQGSMGKIKYLREIAKKSLWYGHVVPHLVQQVLRGITTAVTSFDFLMEVKLLYILSKFITFDGFSWLLEFRNWISNHLLAVSNLLNKHKSVKYLMVFWSVYLASVGWCAVCIKIFRYFLVESCCFLFLRQTFEEFFECRYWRETRQKVFYFNSSLDSFKVLL